MLARAITLVLLLTLAPLANAENLRGVVTSVDASKQELVVEGRGIGKRGKSFTFTLAKDVRILFGDDKGAVTDLARDQTLRITYETKDGALIATTIHVNGSRPAAAKEPVKSDTVAGLLRRVAYTEREIIVASPGDKGKETYTTLPVPEEARITRDGKKIAFDDLKEEERCSVTIEVRDGKKLAIRITIGAGGGAEMPANPEQPSKIARARMLLKLADAILEMIEKRQKKDDK
jgi:hypothetical protein